MMKNFFRSIGTIMCLLLVINALANKPPIKLGSVSKAEVEMKEYAPEPDADAVVLCDYGVRTFNFNMSLGQWEHNLKRVCRIKIFNDDGFDWAEEKILLYDDNDLTESISNIKGFTYNLENGKVVKTKMSKENIFKEKNSKKYTTVKFSMPNVKEGSVIEFSYNVKSNYTAILDRWQFQRSIPVKWSEYIVAIPDYFQYLKNSQGFGSFHVFETKSQARSISWVNNQKVGLRGVTQEMSSQKIDYQDEIYHWVAKDLEPLENEVFVGNISNYYLGVDFQLAEREYFSGEHRKILSDWNEIVRRFSNDYDNFGPNLKPRSFYKDITETIKTTYATQPERIAAVYAYVSDYMKWNKKYGFIPSKNLRKIYDERTGSSADINGLLVSMLRAVEVQADPVITSTVKNGQVHPVYPILDKYNYMLVRATFDGKMILLDATEKNMPIGLLPRRALNMRGYAISQTRPGWVDLKPAKGHENSVYCALTLDTDGTVHGDINAKHEGYSSLNIRASVGRDGQDKYLEELKSKKAEWAIEDLSMDIPEDNSQPVKEKIKLSNMNLAEAMGNMIYISPIATGRLDENPFKQDERMLPIEFGVPLKNNYILSMTIPEGYTVDEIPQSVNLVTSDRTAQLKYAVQVVGNRIQVMNSWHIGESFYGAEKYQELKEFYDMLVAKHQEQIVLKKVSVN